MLATWTKNNNRSARVSIGSPQNPSVETTRNPLRYDVCDHYSDFKVLTMRIPTSRPRASQADMQTAMTPLIDVVFQLLIFFICASTGHMKELLLATDFHAGDVGAASTLEREKPLGEVWIRLKRSENATTAFLEGREFRDLTQLVATLKTLAAASTDIPVNLDIEGEVPLGDVIHVYDACRAARFRSINFAAKSIPSNLKNN